MLQTRVRQNIFLFVVVSCLFFMGALSTQAQTIPVTKLQGYGLSDNIGKIYFSCEDVEGANICSTSNFGVVINSNRKIEGWAWSPGIGWIRFGGLGEYAGYPTGGLGTLNEDAHVTGPLNALQFNGWARACAGITDNLNRCTTGLDTAPYVGTNANAGGWTGWISLSGLTTAPGDSTGYKAVINLNELRVEPNSYAWGGMVVGWINMQQMILVADGGENRLSGTDCPIPIGSNTCTTTLDWKISATSTDPKVRDVRDNRIVSTSLDATQSEVVEFGENPFQAMDGTTILATDIVNASCAGTNSRFNTVTNQCELITTPGVVPTISLRMVPSVVRMGATTMANWTISSLTDTSCVLNGPGFSNTIIASTTGSLPTAALRSVSTFRLTCTSTTGAYAPVEVRSTAEVIPVAAEV